MNYQAAQNELKGKPPKVSYTLLSVETATVLIVAYLMVQFFA